MNLDQAINTFLQEKVKQSTNKSFKKQPIFGLNSKSDENVNVVSESLELNDNAFGSEFIAKNSKRNQADFYIPEAEKQLRKDKLTKTRIGKYLDKKGSLLEAFAELADVDKLKETSLVETPENNFVAKSIALNKLKRKDEQPTTEAMEEEAIESITLKRMRQREENFKPREEPPLQGFLRIEFSRYFEALPPYNFLVSFFNAENNVSEVELSSVSKYKKIIKFYLNPQTESELNLIEIIAENITFFNSLHHIREAKVLTHCGLKRSMRFLAESVSILAGSKLRQGCFKEACLEGHLNQDKKVLYDKKVVRVALEYFEKKFMAKVENSLTSNSFGDLSVNDKIKQFVEKEYTDFYPRSKTNEGFNLNKIFAQVFFLVRTGNSHLVFDICNQNPFPTEFERRFMPILFKFLDRSAPRLNDSDVAVINEFKKERFSINGLKLNSFFHLLTDFMLKKFENRIVTLKTVKLESLFDDDDKIWLEIYTTKENLSERVPALKDSDSAAWDFYRAQSYISKTFVEYRYNLEQCDMEKTCELLIATAQFERLISVLYDFPDLKWDLVHLILALDYYGLLKYDSTFTTPSKSLVELDVTSDPLRATINFKGLIERIFSWVQRSTALEMVEYLNVIKWVFPNTFYDYVRSFVVESESLSMLIGTYGPEEQFNPGLIAGVVRFDTQTFDKLKRESAGFLAQRYFAKGDLSKCEEALRLVKNYNLGMSMVLLSKLPVLDFLLVGIDYKPCNELFYKYECLYNELKSQMEPYKLALASGSLSQQVTFQVQAIFASIDFAIAYHNQDVEGCLKFLMQGPLLPHNNSSDEPQRLANMLDNCLPEFQRSLGRLYNMLIKFTHVLFLNINSGFNKDFSPKQLDEMMCRLKSLLSLTCYKPDIGIWGEFSALLLDMAFHKDLIIPDESV